MLGGITRIMDITGTTRDMEEDSLVGEMVEVADAVVVVMAVEAEEAVEAAAKKKSEVDEVV